MATTSDLEKFSGEQEFPAAAEQQQVDTNSYQQEVLDYPVSKNVLEQAELAQSPSSVEPHVNPQADHFRALREEVDRMKAEREIEKKEFQVQMELYRANKGQQTSQSETFDGAMFAGMKEDDVATVGEIRREWEKKEAAYQARLEELQVQQKYPDYAEVIEKYAAPLAQKDPAFLEALNRVSNKSLFAYQQGKKEQRLQEVEQQLNSYKNAPPKSEIAQRIVENSRKPGTLSQAGGQGTLSKADYYATMSDQEFIRLASRNLEEI